MIECNIVERIAVTGEAGESHTVQVWTLMDTTVRGGREVTIEKERWYRVSNGPFASLAADGTFETIPVRGDGPGMRLRKHHAAADKTPTTGRREAA